MTVDAWCLFWNYFELMIVGAVMCIFEPPDTVTKAGPPPPSIVGSRDTYRSKIMCFFTLRTMGRFADCPGHFWYLKFLISFIIKCQFSLQMSNLACDCLGGLRLSDWVDSHGAHYWVEVRVLVPAWSWWWQWLWLWPWNKWTYDSENRKWWLRV